MALLGVPGSHLFEKVERLTMTHGCTHHPPSQPSGKTITVLIILTTLLMLFSLGLWLLDNQALAVTAGVVAIGLIGDGCRRLLGTDTPVTAAAAQHGEAGTAVALDATPARRADESAADNTGGQQKSPAT
ncbi:hypothetical protein Asi03nite_64280 [Actinoplanes siamensis]|uniref:Uncharacterized protein n=1 Tax=Actinoplanes siamensis TaxID=1223317 RepID=A0A919TPH3_9ACTN|nr:hypothetical protein [Actinoplanes siamensis]GIF08890.1 hypothetical protein Asi03nite_64280 [Actinoplanes siamensis]